MKFLIHLLCVLITVNSTLASAPFVYSNVGDKERVQEVLSSQKVRFLENKGQLADANGNPVHSVLYTASTPGLNMYITETGITYLFIKMKEDKESEWKRWWENHVGNKEDQAKEEIEVEWTRIDVTLKNASIKRANVIAEGASITNYNYFQPHCPGGIYGVKEYEKITIKDVYPNIDWVFYNSSKTGVKYDFIVHPGADPALVKLVYHSQHKLLLAETGDIQISTKLGLLTEMAPVTFLSDKKIESQFIVNSSKRDQKSGFETEIGFNIPDFNNKLNNSGEDIVIDPQLFWGTFVGGGGGYQGGIEGVKGLSTDASNNVYTCGYASSTSFYPLVNPGGTAYYSGTVQGQVDATIMKISSTGVILWSTFYGGSLDDDFAEIAIDGSNIYLVGATNSANFPTQSGGGYLDNALGGSLDGIIAKFNTSGQRLWATYFGGSANDDARGVTTNASGQVFVVGFTASSSASFPKLTMAGAYYDGTQGSTAGDMFVARFSSGTVQDWTTFFGGSSGNEGADDVVCDASGNIFVVGNTFANDITTMNPGGGAYYSVPTGASRECFIIKFNSACALVWATGFGGGGFDIAYDSDIDNNGNLYVVGQAGSGFPMLDPGGGAFFDNSYGGGASDAFLSKFSNTGVLTWSTFIGGGGREYGWGGTSSEDFSIAVNKSCGDLYIGLITEGGCPVLASCDGGYYDGTFNGGNSGYVIDQFVAHFSSTGVQLWGTYIAGNGMDYRVGLTVDSQGSLYASGEWAENSANPGTLSSATYPLLDPGSGAYYSTFKGLDDAFLMKFTKTPLTATTTPSGTGTCVCSAIANPVGGCSGTYTYSWDTSPVQTTQTATNLCTGNYNVTVTDAMCNTVIAPVTISCIVQLPVEITSFWGEKVDRINKLYWQTATEYNNDYFLLEKSEDALNWEFLAIVDGAGNSTTPIDYTVTDSLPYQLTYYRLKQFDFDHSTTYTGIISLENTNPNTFIVYPNPSNGQFSVQWSADYRDEIELVVLDARGRLIQLQTKNIEKGTNHFDLDISEQAAGVYFIGIRNSEFCEFQKILKR